MRIYIESTIPSYIVARPARDLLQAARQQLAKDWWEFERNRHELFTSQVVLDEIAFGEKEMAEHRLETMRGIPLLRGTDEVQELAGKILASGLLPATADRDATHIALASVYEMDILLTWNSRHIANATIRQRLQKVVEAAGFGLPVICAPEELMENDNEQTD
jgi:predicted nucleic acid-binding protein